ncbi:MAG: hypothetical protein ACOC8S_06835, partial [Bacteroidota bacterium]
AEAAHYLTANWLNVRIAAMKLYRKQSHSLCSKTSFLRKKIQAVRKQRINKHHKIKKNVQGNKNIGYGIR